MTEETRYRTTVGRAKDWPLSKRWNVAHDCDRCKRASANGVFYEPDEVRHRRDEHGGDRA